MEVARADEMEGSESGGGRRNGRLVIRWEPMKGHLCQRES